jgi:RNA recognition motif-containing protein
MSKRLFVGSLAWGTTEATLKKHFEQAGAVESAAVIMDKMSGRSKGFGFVEMTNDADADAAVVKLNGTELDGRKIVVSEARPKVQQ